MVDLFPITLDEMIAEAKRESELRHRVYDRMVSEGRLGALLAERRIAVMDAIVETLCSVKSEPPQGGIEQLIGGGSR